MVREMLRVGHQPPVIQELDGPYVRASLVGDAIDDAWIAWLGTIEPADEASDVSSLLILRQIVSHGWIDEVGAAKAIQLTAAEAHGAIRKLAGARIGGSDMLQRVNGVPDGTPAVWRLSEPALTALAGLNHASGNSQAMLTRSQVAVSYARARGRISSTELGSLVGAAPSNVGGILKALAADGILRPSSPLGRGQGFHYKWVGDNASQEESVGDSTRDSDIEA